MKPFVDTNVLIYAYDLDADGKHRAAKTALQDLWNSGSGVLSMQVLQELYVNVTRKIASPLSRDIARRVVDSYSAWCVETATAELAAAFQIEDEARIVFGDALIVASAMRSGAVRILSEDLNVQQMMRGIRIENPFADVH